MPLPSFLKRKDPPAAKKTRGAPAAEEGSLVEQARTRARRRLIGALVLLAAGIIVFPLVFDTQPRPLPSNLPIEVARNGTHEVELPAPSPAPRPRTPVLADAPSEPPPQESPPATPSPAPEPASAAPRATLPAPTPVPSPSPAPSPAPTPSPAATPAPAKPPASAAAPAASRPVADARRAQALLDGAPASAAHAGRFVVQVGAYTDTAAVREARAKVEKLGMKTYTQVIESDTGRRTRVRVGPFASREEADAASARLKGAGLPVVVLTL